MLFNCYRVVYSWCGYKHVYYFTTFRRDKTAKKVVDDYIKYLSSGVLNYCNIFRPEVVILGGGMSHIGSPLLDKVISYVKKNNYGYKCSPMVEIKLATLENNAGIVGGRALFEE